jgi:hypothetical protein
MNDREFIELLNLYLDHEIAPADAARLEAEVRDNPERRRIYLDYCRMQKACGLLAKDFAKERPADRQESRSTGFGWAAAGFASFGVVAAGLAVAFALWLRPSGRVAGELALAQSTQAATEAPAAPLAPRRGRAAASDQASVGQLVLTGETLGLSGGLRLRSSASATAATGDELDWLRNFAVSALPSTEAAAALHFNHSAGAIRPEVRNLGLKAQAEAAEMTAFRFSR